jgi:predicted dehydrogenase
MKIGILGTAHIHADAYAGCLMTIPGIGILGVADDRPARGAAFAQTFGIRHFESCEALLDAQPDGVIITSENSKHRILAEKAAVRGVHILCEKPLATTPDDARAMVEAARRAGSVLMTAFPMRFSVPVRMVRDQLEAGKLGSPFCFNASNQGMLPPGDRPWFTDPLLSGGGAVADHLVHLADILRWYLGREAIEVYAKSNRIFHADKVAVETGGMVIISFEGGVFASIDCSWSRPENWPGWGGLSFDMITDRGAVRVDAFKQNLTLYSTGDIIKDAGLSHGGSSAGSKWLYWGSDANRAMIEEFVFAIREGRPPAVTGDDGLRAVEIVDAAYRSIRKGQPVTVRRSGFNAAQIC